jgi:hypothetical protein
MNPRAQRPDPESDGHTPLTSGNDVPAAPSRDISTERVRLHRERRRNKLALVTIEVFHHEIRDLIRLGWLRREDLIDRAAIGRAIERFLAAAIKAEWSA